MRSRRTTNILLLLAFLFILAIIILCLPSSTKRGQKSQSQQGIHETFHPEDDKTIIDKTSTTTKEFTVKPTSKSSTTTTPHTTATEHTPTYAQTSTISKTSTTRTAHTTTTEHTPTYAHTPTTEHTPKYEYTQATEHTPSYAHTPTTEHTPTYAQTSTISKTSTTRTAHTTTTEHTPTYAHTPTTEHTPTYEYTQVTEHTPSYAHTPTTEHTPTYAHTPTAEHTSTTEYIATSTHAPTTEHIPKTTTKRTPATTTFYTSTTMETTQQSTETNATDETTLYTASVTETSKTQVTAVSHENASFILITNDTTEYSTPNLTEPINETSTTPLTHLNLTTLNISTETSTVSFTSPVTSTKTTTTPTTPSTITSSTTTTTTIAATTTIAPSTTIKTTTPYIHLFDFYTEAKGICTSADCKDFTSKMLDSINHNLNPCENFYEFACGGVTQDSFLEPENANKHLDSILKDQLPLHQTDAFTFYQSCVAFLQGSEIIDYGEVYPSNWKVALPHSEITEWPSKHLTELIISLMKRDISILFDVTVDVKSINEELKPVPKIRISVFDSYEKDEDHIICVEEFHDRLNTKYREMTLDNSTDRDIKLNGSTFEYDESYDELERHSEHVNMIGHLKRRKSSRKTTKTHERLQILKNNESESTNIDIDHEYRQYLECMNTTGLDARLNSLKTAVNEFQLFDPSMKELERKTTLENVKWFLRDINAILLSSSPKEKKDSTTTATLLEIKNDKELGGSIDWSFFFNNLYDQKMNESQEILLVSKEKLSKLFYYFKSHWNGRNLENIFLMLAAEKMFVKWKNFDLIKEHCFQTTKRLLPDDMSLLFTKSYHQNDTIKLIGEINMLGSKVSSRLAKLSTVHSQINTTVEFVEMNTLNAQIEERKNEIKILDNYLDNIHVLQKKKRSDMYKLLEMDTIQQEDCRFLPRETKIKCNLLTGRNLVPLEQLVPPNYYYAKKIPNYLRLAGVTFYITTTLTQNMTELSIEGYEDMKCVREKIPSSFHVSNHKHIKAKNDIENNLRKETSDQFRALNIVWRVIRKLNWDNVERSVNETHEMSLIWLDGEDLTPLQAFVIRKAQGKCRSSNKIDLIKTARFRLPPESFWVNNLIKTDPIFTTAFKCPSDSRMNFIGNCSKELTTLDWYDPYSITTEHFNPVNPLQN